MASGQRTLEQPARRLMATLLLICCLHLATTGRVFAQLQQPIKQRQHATAAQYLFAPSNEVSAQPELAAGGVEDQPISWADVLSGAASTGSAPSFQGLETGPAANSEAAAASLGRYEFEVAPKMEPPTVRKPPYRQLALACPGSDPFAGFSPRHTLCGDLNQGSVPLNPLGQNIADQAYPFELIKNKTLQFLARALPVLKNEYEAIPKVARYLPANRLLNPTSLQSPLGRDHFHTLNQQLSSLLGYGPDGSEQLAAAADLNAPANERHRRRRRSIQTRAKLTDAPNQPNPVSAAEMMLPNATLVVSSAHSAGRIHQPAPFYISNNQTATVFGYHRARPLVQVTSPSLTVANSRPATGATSGSTTAAPAGRVGAAASSPPTSAARDQDANQVAPQQIGGEQNGAATRQQHQTAPIKNSNDADPLQGSAKVAAAATKPTASKEQVSSAAGAGVQHNGATEVQARAAATAKNDHENGGQNSPGSSPVRSSDSVGQEAGAQRRRSQSSSPPTSTCAEFNNFLTSTICQTVSALVEGDKAPAWLQLAKQLGNLYTSDNIVQASASANPLWSLWNAFGTPSDPTSNTKSTRTNDGTNQGTTRLVSLLSSLNPLTGLLAPNSGKDSSSKYRHSTPTSITVAPTSESRNDENENKTSTNSQSSNPIPKQQLANKHDHRQQSSGWAATLSKSTLGGLALATWTSALLGLFDYVAPQVFSSSSTFARRKKPFDPSETFVDTPVSQAAAQSANNIVRAATSQEPQSVYSKQPPTPCPSVEEYISPTFARNYQGAWKYVVQIPHEGYFTQTVQRSSCARQKCEFTDGVCHEAPRWVSLLVAEIYYPNAVFSSQSNQVDDLSKQQQMFNMLDAQQQQQQLQAAASQQVANRPALKPGVGDPMQIADSLSMFGHNSNINGNNLLYSAIADLGLDPNQIHQLANSASNQLSQRNGFVPQRAAAPPSGQQTFESSSSQQMRYAAPQVTERRSFTAAGRQLNPLEASHQRQRQFSQLPVASQNEQLQQMFMYSPSQLPQQQTQPATYIDYNDYIKRLAAETLQQNPHMTLDDLIKSLQLSQSRRKRDISSQQQQLQYHDSTTPARFTTLVEPQYTNNLQSPSVQQDGQSNSMPELSSGLSGQPNPQVQMRPNNQDLQMSASNNNLEALRQGSISAAASSRDDAQANPTPMLPPSSPPTPSPNSADVSQAAQQSGINQVECDGHDKIGCYVVRVYYDWFLVNGSCKCWRTNSSGSSTNQQPSAGSNNFLKRIFTG